jgi:N-acetyl-anhydromuramyl-L-alanine amidase AmpD
MKKAKVIFWAIFLAVILPLAFLLVKFFFNQNNSGFNKISWGKPEEGLKDNLILAPLTAADSEPNNIPSEQDKPKEKITEKPVLVSLSIKNHLVNWGFAESAQRTVDTIIIHSSYDALSGNPYSLEGLIKEYQQYGVTPHYLIDRKGIIYRLVEDKNTAFHAGASQTPDGRTNVNAFSLGIEIMNTQTDSPTKEQYAALKKLIDFLRESYKIKYVLGHNQIAEGRKDDPWNFDWGKIQE